MISFELSENSISATLTFVSDFIVTSSAGKETTFPILPKKGSLIILTTEP